MVYARAGWSFLADTNTPRRSGRVCTQSGRFVLLGWKEWLPFVDDIRTALFENAEEIRGMIPGLRCAGLIPNVGR